jgi:uncharacterized membrane protein YfcA
LASLWEREYVDELWSALPLLLTASFFAGALNAVAGGGSFLTLPTLVFLGLPPVSANATGTVALLPGYLSGTLGFREDMRMPPGISLAGLVGASLVGGASGAGLLLLTPNETFSILIPWLLLAATAVFALGPRLLRLRKSEDGARPLASVLAIFAVAVYGGYFNGGLGIILLALFGLLGLPDLNAANGLKNLVSALLTAIAVAVYAWGGAVSWPEALLMMIGATAGGYLGARAIRRVRPTYVRYGVILIGLVMAGLFFAR